MAIASNWISNVNCAELKKPTLEFMKEPIVTAMKN